jgi:hypothetical protein
LSENLVKNSFTRISLPLNRCIPGSRIAGAEHKIGSNLTLLRDEGIQHTTPNITSTKNNWKYLSKNFSNSTRYIMILKIFKNSIMEQLDSYWTDFHEI